MSTTTNTAYCLVNRCIFKSHRLNSSAGLHKLSGGDFQTVGLMTEITRC